MKRTGASRPARRTTTSRAVATSANQRRHPVDAYVALGSNLEDPARQVLTGLSALGAMPGTRLVASSSLYRTAPVGYRDQPDFVNAVAMLRTTLEPRALLNALLGIERTRGRVREFADAPRTLDLDLLLYGDCALREAGLVIPHPRLHERGFVLVPLAEIAPDLVVPGRGAVAALVRNVDLSGVARIGSALRRRGRAAA